MVSKAWVALVVALGIGPSGLAMFAALADERAAPAIRIGLAGPAQEFFVPERQGCDGNDVPDAPLRALRAADGTLKVFGLHYTNHFLAGPSFEALRVVCRSALPSNGNPDPKAYDDKSWIAATWTRDGTVIDALVHHEFQADSHPGRCRFATYMQCWFNSVVAVRSTDAGATFVPATSRVVASAPFGQEIEQGRHRGFFNPSNIFENGRFAYALMSTTGWPGQSSGVCLFRTATPDAPGSWRAFDGRDFTIRYADPYATPNRPLPRPCQTLAPFPAPVGSVVRQRGSGLWLAVFQAAKDAGSFPVSGLYLATSRDLLRWSAPRLIVPGATNYEDPCTASGSLLAYPALLDPAAEGRNFDDVGGTADLFYTRMSVAGCAVGRRVLLRQPVDISADP